VNLSQNRINIWGWIGVTCIAFTWAVMLIPKWIAVVKPVLDAIGPLQWLVVIAMIVMPVLAAKHGSKWWLAVTAVGVITLVIFLRRARG